MSCASFREAAYLASVFLGCDVVTDDGPMPGVLDGSGHSALARSISWVSTPMVRLGRVAPHIATPVVAKLETANPGGSVKDRAAVAMIDAAEADWAACKPGDTIVEPTSGNTGVGLAVVAAQRGYRCLFVCTDKVAPEKVALLRAYGAEVVVCPAKVDPARPGLLLLHCGAAAQPRRPGPSRPISTRTRTTPGRTIARPPGPRSGPRPAGG